MTELPNRESLPSASNGSPRHAAHSVLNCTLTCGRLASRISLPKLSIEEVLVGVFFIAIGGLFLSFNI